MATIARQPDLSKRSSEIALLPSPVSAKSVDSRSYAGRLGSKHISDKRDVRFSRGGTSAGGFTICREVESKEKGGYSAHGHSLSCSLQNLPILVNVLGKEN